MKSSIILSFSLQLLSVAVVVFTDAQNLDSIEVETRDNPNAYLREKRQLFHTGPQVVVPQVIAPSVAAQIDILSPSSGCFWSGTSPFCFPACGNKFQEMLTDIRGNGKRCWTGFKKLCCPIPPGMIKFKG
ncbi:uncharacterized protein LOC130693758 isoform X1 [Daphnia carinata]|uniref:uncharacterized protein LOC130693758 isoform X1 n=1 Tax=Daphnia carinata TaxID=120202 RepID=UPI00257E5724|nr:uncharacterized protein LOC130693758 isoform X1 [Daphnia carinata]